MPADLSPVIAATTQWLVRSYPAAGGALSAALAEVQARQAVTVAAGLRYPTALDAELVAFTGPGGAARLDWLTGADAAVPATAESAWRSWVDEVVASWAACLLTDTALAAAAVGLLASAEECPTAPAEYRRLTAPGESEWQAAPLLRHPDLLAPVAGLHREGLLERLGDSWAEAA